MNSYGRIREKKLTEADKVLTCQTLKQELQQEIDIENRRINVDSAKKRAVLQHMDYEGFRQMVMGAHLYRIKSRDLRDFSIRAPHDQILNPLQTTFNNVQTLEQEQQVIEYNALLQRVKSLQCNNFREFRAAFAQAYRKPVDDQVVSDVDMLLKSQTTDNWKKIVSVDFQISIFMDMLDIFEMQISQIDQVCFILSLMDALSEFKDFQFQVPKFLKKSEKERINQFIEKLNNTQFQDVTEDFHLMLAKVTKYYKI